MRVAERAEERAEVATAAGLGLAGRWQGAVAVAVVGAAGGAGGFVGRGVAVCGGRVWDCGRCGREQRRAFGRVAGAEEAEGFLGPFGEAFLAWEAGCGVWVDVDEVGFVVGAVFRVVIFVPVSLLGGYEITFLRRQGTSVGFLGFLFECAERGCFEIFRARGCRRLGHLKCARTRLAIRDGFC